MEYHSKYTGAEVDALLGKVESGDVGGKVTVDSALSTTSENPVMNKVITEELNKKATPMKSVTYEELAELRDNGELIAGMQYRITDYVTTTAQENTRSAGHPFDVIVLALTNDTLSERAWACYHDGDTYFHNSHLEAWQIWYSLDNDAERFAWADAQNGKGVIYRMIDEWNNDCPYDFKNIQFKRGVYDGGGIAPDGDEDLHLFLYTFSFRTNELTEVLDTSIFGNNGRLLNDEGQITGVYDNVIGQYMAYDGSIENPTKTSQRLNDIVFYSHYDYEGDLYYGCFSNSFGNGCFSNSFGNNCFSNSLGNVCFSNSLGNGCYNNSLGNGCYNNSLGDDCFSNSLGDDCYNNSLGNGCFSNSFGNGCFSNSFGNVCHFNTFGNGCFSNSFKDMDGRADNVSCNKLDSGVYGVELYHDDNNGLYGELKYHHICSGVTNVTIDIYSDNIGVRTYTLDSNGVVRDFILGDLASLIQN